MGEEIEENVYSICTYCKYDPKSGNNGGSKNNGGAKRNNNGGSTRNGGAKRNNGGSRNVGSRGKAGSRKNGGGNGRSKNSQYDKDIANGKIPGQAGKDYPTFSLKQLEKKGFKGIQPAPADKIVKNYPKQNGKGGGGGNRSSGGHRSGGSGGGGAGGNCPGSLEDCMAACPSQMRVFKVCVSSCSKRCARK